MLGSRTKIVLLTFFFTFTFAIMFLALIQNYAQAGVTPLVSTYVLSDLDKADVHSSMYHEIVPNFGVEQHVEFDFYTDSSFQKYLNTDHPFTDDSYIPTDLIPIDSNFTANNSKAFKLREEASLHFADMAWNFRNAFSGDRLYISSAYRSRGFQDYLIKQGCSLLKCAKIGTSEHQAGLAVDIKVISKGGKSYSLDNNGNPNKYYDWLKANAADFGFHNTYQKGVEVDGKIVEGWHRRYVGTELATVLSENNQTFAEYYNSMNNE